LAGHLRDAGVVLALLCAVAVLLLAAVLVRQWALHRRGGVVECSLRALPADGAPGPWRLGVGRYKGDELHWHRAFEVRIRPRQVIHRRGLVVSNRRAPDPAEAVDLPPEAGIVEIRNGDQRLELAMNSAALTGFLAWLEAAPPGFPVDLS